MPVKPIPEGYHTATPYLTVNDARAAIDFYKRAFNATEIMRFEMGGRIGHAEVRIGNSPIMLSDEFPGMGCPSPRTLGGATGSIMLYVDDVDTWFNRAVAAGGKSIRPVADQFYGDRAGTIEDPFGYIWTMATHKEDVSMDDLRKRAEAMKPCE